MVTCVLSAALGHDSCGVLRSVDNKQSAEISVWQTVEVPVPPGRETWWELQQDRCHLDNIYQFFNVQRWLLNIYSEDTAGQWSLRTIQPLFAGGLRVSLCACVSVQCAKGWGISLCKLSTHLIYLISTHSFPVSNWKFMKQSYETCLHCGNLSNPDFTFCRCEAPC